MQQKQVALRYHIKMWAMGTLWVIGLLLAGSDSNHMPWVNIIGLILFLCVSLLLGRALGQNNRSSENKNIIYPDFKTEYRSGKALKNRRFNRRRQERYAMSA